MDSLVVYALTLASTVSIETPIVTALCRRRSTRTVAAVAVLVNLATHPLASVLISVGRVDWLAVELGVLAVEALALRALLDLSWRRALAVALVANATTAALALGWTFL